MSLVPSLLRAIVQVDGEALVMHAGDKPYVIAPVGQIELASSVLANHAVVGIVAQLLPAEFQHTLDECGAVQYDLPPQPSFPRERFTLVAARGGGEEWAEIRRRRATDEGFEPAHVQSAPAAEGPPAPATRVAAPDDRLKELEEVDRRIQALKEAARQAEQEVAQTLLQAAMLRRELDQIRSGTTALTQDFGRIRETSREASESATAAVATVREIEEKLVFVQLHESGQTKEERLDSLNTFGELLVKTKLNTFAERVRTLQGAVTDADRRIEALEAQVSRVAARLPSVENP